MKFKYYVMQCLCPEYETASFEVIHETSDVEEAFNKLNEHEESLIGTWMEDDCNCYVEVVKVDHT